MNAHFSEDKGQDFPNTTRTNWEQIQAHPTRPVVCTKRLNCLPELMLLHPSSLSRHFDLQSKTHIRVTAHAAEVPETGRFPSPRGSMHCNLGRRCPLKPDPWADPAKNRGSYPLHSGDPSARTPRKTRHTPDSAFGRARSCSPFNFHKPWDHSLRHLVPLLAAISE